MLFLRVSYITISSIMTSFAADVSSASLFGSVQDPPTTTCTFSVFLLILKGIQKIVIILIAAHLKMPSLRPPPIICFITSSHGEKEPPFFRNLPLFLMNNHFFPDTAISSSASCASQKAPGGKHQKDGRALTSSS